MFARTERLMLRPVWQEDAAMIAAIVQSERKVRDLFGASNGCDLAAPCALESCGHDASLPKLLVFRRTSGAPELIGMVALDRHGRREARLVCWISRSHRGNGYGSEAARAMLHLAREGLRLDRLVTDQRSDARFLRRLGFTDGEMRLLESEPSPTECPRQAQAA